MYTSRFSSLARFALMAAATAVAFVDLFVASPLRSAVARVASLWHLTVSLVENFARAVVANFHAFVPLQLQLLPASLVAMAEYVRRQVHINRPRLTPTWRMSAC